MSHSGTTGLAELSQRSRLRPLAHAALVVALSTGVFAWVYGSAVLEDIYLAESDLYEYFLPVFLSKFALWSAFEFAGIPTFTDPGEAFPYPLYFLFAKVIGSWNWFVISAHVLAACGTYAYVYMLTRRPAAACFASLAFGLSEATLERLAHATTLHTIGMMPFMFICIERLIARDSPRWAALGVLSVACVILAGHPQPAFYACLTAAAYAAVGGLMERKSRRYYIRLLVMFGAAAALAAIKVLPFVEVTLHMARDTINFNQFISRGNTGPQLWTFLFPPVPHDGREAPTYVGLATIVLALVGATRWRRHWRAAFWVVAVIIAVLFGIGEHSPIARFAFDYVPFYDRFRVGARHLIIACFGTAILAGFGLRFALEDPRSRRRLSVAAALFIVTFVAGLVYLSTPHAGLELELRHRIRWSDYGLPAGMANDLWTQTLLAIATLACLAGVAFGARQRRWVTALVLVLAADLLNAQPHALTTRGLRAVSMPRSAALPSVHALEIKRDLAPGHQRALAIGGTSRDAVLPATWARIWEIPIAGGYGPMLLQRHALMSTMGRNGAVRTSVLAPSDQSLDLLAVKSIIVQPSQDITSQGTWSTDGVTFEREPLGLDIGRSACGHEYPRSTTLVLPSETAISEVHVIAHIRCADHVPQDTEVGTLSVTGAGGLRFTKTLRAGVDVAEAELKNPGVKARTRHRPPRAVADPAAPDRFHSLVSWPLPSPVHGARLEITGSGFGGWLAIGRLTVFDERGHALPQARGELFLRDGDRWREVRRFRTHRYTDRGADADAEGEQDYVVYDNRRALPRAWIVPDVEVLTLEDALGAIQTSRLTDGRPFDARKTALVHAEDPNPGTLAFGGSRSSVAVEEAANGRLTMAVSSERGGFLVVSETYYPGWRATVDGADAPVYRANVSLQGILVPPGNHKVVFVFKPRALYAGAAISALGLLAVVVLIAGRPRIDRNTRLPVTQNL